MADGQADFENAGAGISELRAKGVRLTLDAEQLLKNGSEKLLKEIVSLQKLFITREDVEAAMARLNEPVEMARPRERPAAAECAPDIKILHQFDVTGKSRTTGSVDDFVAYFRNRYQRMSRLLSSASKYPTVGLGDIKKEINQNVRIVVMVYEKRDTKKGSVLLEVEDLEGKFKVVVPRSNEKTYEKARRLLRDEVVSITGKVLEQFIIAEEVEWPDLPVMREKKLGERDLACAYISDIHVGSRHFLEKQFQRFVDWLNLKGGETEIAGKVKYVIVAGDIADGVGIYPKQEKDLAIKDVYKQYEVFDNYMEMMPDYIEVIVAPGNHDAVRRAEPMPAIEDSVIRSDVTRVGSPTVLEIEGIKHVVYHGTSMDSMISGMSGLSYNNPEKVSMEYLKRRHLSPIYGTNQIVPERVDYLVLETEPDVLHCGHVHKNGYAYYRGTHVINSGTFQDRTDFQVQQGHVPTPGMVGVLEMKSGVYKTLDFSKEA
ncbi:MAG: DNA-directed DNA polymerase II small subunit [Candidatus ainarchaeum sp.]|nr:DNA-directed DNA polymerase II small subunit [Candidatus ainarchaeum sp.]